MKGRKSERNSQLGRSKDKRKAELFLVGLRLSCLVYWFGGESCSLQVTSAGHSIMGLLTSQLCRIWLAAELAEVGNPDNRFCTCLSIIIAFYSATRIY